MSGGEYDYICHKIQDVKLHRQDENPRRAAFQRLLHLVADAMHDIEWVDSCDMSPGDENEAIDRCFAFLQQDPTVIVKAAAYDALKERLTEYLKL